MTKPRILVTGSNGQLGKSLKELSGSYPGFDFIFLSRADLPIHHFELLRNTFNAHHPQYCINCAAYTNVDRAEQEKELAFQVNGEAVGVLAAVCPRSPRFSRPWRSSATSTSTTSRTTSRGR